MKQRQSKSRAGNGFSLVEILVVLVILLIGILAILRLFPGGFLTIVHTGEMTAAQALAEQQTNSARNQTTITDAHAAGLPNMNGDIVLINGISPDDLTEASATDLTRIENTYNFMVPTGYSPHYFSNVNKLRYVIGETTRLPVTSPGANSGGGPTYTLQAGPVFNLFGTDSNGQPKDSIQVYGTPLDRVGVANYSLTDTTQYATLLNNDYNAYAIDYANKQILFWPRAANNRPVPYRLFKFTATIYSPGTGGGITTDRTSTTIQSSAVIQVNDVQPQANGTLVAVWQPYKLINSDGTDVTATAQIWPGTEQVSRKFRLVTASTVSGGASPNAPAFTTDPYEYAWYSPQIGTANANLGTLIFNPIGHTLNPADPTLQANASNPTPSVDALMLGSDGKLTVKIDYLTYDNQIIRDDRSVPNAAPYNIRLALPYLQTGGDILPDQSTYNGIFTEATSTPTPDVILYNTATGAIVGEVQAGTFVQQAGWVNGTMDATNGILFLDTTNANGTGVQDLNLQSTGLRILYRTQKRYGMQVQQATSQYVAVSDPAATDYRSFYIGGSGTAGGSANTLYFDVSQAGKTINIGEYYLVPTNGSSPVRHTNETFQIQDNSANFVSLNGHLYATVVLPSGTLNSTVTGRAISNVQGASFKSRVIWLGSQQSSNVGGNNVFTSRWRKVDNDTVLQPTNQ